ncbi:2-amino-4-hydroxy-6-hydroxymethyldihydropteridine diphosphokinase [Mucilaginibacter myungsuensis]|uniref:2-amino-4-hydroxy-6-hydroxymethyldihydropteridine pyrophosphokinase n=1 Tax=Mucilaginibacter myungsuensis TaxID=649104 RepID=A0A929L1D3_9SPHI|nr:2-amino-4-hydroxy-6-hydroxymethyldihydropteridine diphosphokinase [Mucilaginibacter myungsuensis]MBE9664348.1 2-amino-4-hydroxy-6-hydroxymethyldihydropteridine diphosphokinase [Mucilaginibacter myungsuensis]MDN3597058.1 2-amino-4-hydroxy-6-hydroxymethyldihydropteridine diphosphokinase [Mucilaginibacter myungsuensis]
MFDIFLLLGSNLGDRRLFLQQAINRVGVEVGVVTEVSSVYETQSWGNTSGPDYLNQVIRVQTQLSARNVLNKVLAIELEFGRERKEKWGARTLDIDILFYADHIVNEPGLTIPHPYLQERRFTMEPLAEIAPLLQHPVLNRTMLELKNELTDSLIVKKL